MTMILTRIRYCFALVAILSFMAVSCEGIGGAGGNAGSPGSPVQEENDDSGDDSGQEGGDDSGEEGGDDSGEEGGGGASQPADSVIRVATYNLLVCDGRRKEMTMDKAGATLGKAVAACKADIISLNEIDETLVKNMPAWAAGAGATGLSWDMTHPNKVVSGVLEYYYSNGLAYNADRFEVIGRGMYWYLSSGRLTANSSTASSYHVPKYCTLVWARFKQKSTDRTFYFVSTHFPLADDGTDDRSYKKGEAHERCASALETFVLTLPDPCIVCGDLNSSAQATDACASGYSTLSRSLTNVYDELQSKGTLDPLYRTCQGTLSGSSAKYYYTAEVFTKNHPERRIDHIMYRNAGEFSFVPRSYDTVWTTYTYGGKAWCPSDHLPVAVEFVMR
ncbi:MAG: endonuclease/exonuclease/phosphatase family protein [Bacteroidales bacterium]|nr:endonuclease/exonuclease/phosphatase family protein [Bacteroidales bacterium]